MENYTKEAFFDICYNANLEMFNYYVSNGFDMSGEESSYLRLSLCEGYDEGFKIAKIILHNNQNSINDDVNLSSFLIFSDQSTWEFEFYDRNNQFIEFYPLYTTIFLISNGIDINILNNENETPLDITIKIGHILGEKLIRGLGGKTSKELLELTFEDDNEGFNNLNKDFFYACIRKDKAKIDNLISKGVNLNSFYKLKGVNYGFLRACLSELKSDNFELAKYLIDRGLDVNLDKSIFTYILAKEISDRDYNFYVLKEKEYFSNESKRNKSFNDISLIGTHFLLDNKVDINILDYSEISPLDIAIEYKHLPSMELLKSLGAKTSEEINNTI
jgi:ankyrin repeat protein